MNKKIIKIIKKVSNWNYKLKNKLINKKINK